MYKICRNKHGVVTNSKWCPICLDELKFMCKRCSMPFSDINDHESVCNDVPARFIVIYEEKFTRILPYASHEELFYEFEPGLNKTYEHITLSGTVFGTKNKKYVISHIYDDDIHKYTIKKYTIVCTENSKDQTIQEFASSIKPNYKHCYAEYNRDPDMSLYYFLNKQDKLYLLLDLFQNGIRNVKELAYIYIGHTEVKISDIIKEANSQLDEEPKIPSITQVLFLPITYCFSQIAGKFKSPSNKDSLLK